MLKELNGVQCEESKSVPGKSRGRQIKSREQLQGLEDFYTEHKYPSDTLKAEIAVKLNLTDKQVTVWFCHRRLKDKRLLLKEESQTPGRQDFSSGVIQDHGSGLKQDSCSSTKQADCKQVDPREVESLRFSRENLLTVELNFPQTGGGGSYDELGSDWITGSSSSENNSTSQESFYPHNRSNLPVRAMECRASNGFVQPNRGCVGPSGYLKIKGQIENAAITAVKRQLGRYYREDGPSLGIEFDLLPPEAFESPSKNTYDEGSRQGRGKEGPDDPMKLGRTLHRITAAYGVPNPVNFGRHDISEIQKHSALGTMRNEKRFEALQGKDMHKSDPGKIYCRQPKRKLSFPNHSHGFLDQNSSFGIDSYFAQESSDYNSGRSLNILPKYDTPGMRSDSRSNYPSHSYGRKSVGDPKESFLPGSGSVDPKVFRKREPFFSRPADIGRYDTLPSNRIIKQGDEVYAGGRSTSEHNNKARKLEMVVNEFKDKQERKRRGFTGQLSHQNFSKPSTVVNTKKRALGVPASFNKDKIAETRFYME